MMSLLTRQGFRIFSCSQQVTFRRGVTSQSTSIVYSEHGDPASILKPVTDSLPEVGSGEVLVKMLAAPVNPADINMIQGVYPVKPQLPAVGGNEGVGKVQEAGSGVSKLKVGDWVLPNAAGLGTWRTAMICKEQDLIPIKNDIPVTAAATLAVNPCTAYRMLKDFEKLEQGDYVIQNGGNSGVGQAVIQIAAAMGLKTINIVRNRPNIDELVSMLEDIGATHVITDEFVRSKDMKTFMKSIKPPKLALNCVGGKSVADLMKYLAEKGSLVTYGGMSKQPLMVPAGPLIFKDVKLHGYWMTKWTERNSDNPERKVMLDTLCSMIKNKSLITPPVNCTPISKFKDAIENAMKPFTTQKQILTLDEETKI